MIIIIIIKGFLVACLSFILILALYKNCLWAIIAGILIYVVSTMLFFLVEFFKALRSMKL